MSEINKGQKDFWSGKGGDVWVERQNAMDTMLNPLGHAAMNKLNLKDGENVLDLGCGCGHTTLDIAKKILPNGKVTGLDISVPMLKRAKESAIKESLNNVSFNCVDVQTDDIGEDIYSSAFSRFGVMFFEDSVAAFKNINKSLRLGASLSFVCWQSSSLNPWQSLFIQEIKKFLDLPSPPPRSPGPFAFMESDYVISILEESNFQDIEIEGHKEEVTMFPGRNLPEAIKDYISINPVVTQMLKDSPEELKNKIINSAEEAFSPYFSDKGLVFPSATWLVSAKK